MNWIKRLFNKNGTNKQCDIHVVSSMLCEHNNCSWNKDPNILKCLDCGEEISRA